MPLIISLEGNIGSGKSTLVEYLKENYSFGTYKIGFIDEPVDMWNTFIDPATNETVIEKYYKDQKKYAFSFQMMAYISRLSAIRKALRGDYDIIFTERSVYTDRNVFAKMLYDSGMIEEINYKIYLKWFDEFVDDIQNIKLVYIKTTPEVAYSRVVKRNRQGETIPIEYLTQCNDYHDAWIDSVNTDDKLIVDGNTDNMDTQFYMGIANDIGILLEKILLEKVSQKILLEKVSQK